MDNLLVALTEIDKNKDPYVLIVSCNWQIYRPCAAG